MYTKLDIYVFIETNLLCTSDMGLLLFVSVYRE